MVRFPPDASLTARATPSLSLPAYLTPGADANTGASITRITNTGVGFSTQYRRHEYSKRQPWNADGSKIFLGQFSYGILDGNTYVHQKEISNNCPSHPLWSETDPNLIYGTENGNQFRAFTVSSEAKTTIYTVSGASALSIGDGEGNFSHDGRYIALQATISGHYWVYVYDVIADSLISSFDLGTTAPDWVSMSASGTYVVVNWAQDGTSRSQGVEVFSRAGTFLRQVYPNGEHGDLGISVAGDEVLVTMNEGATVTGGTASIDMMRLADGARTKLWLKDGDIDIYNCHVSCRNTKRPGWAYFNTNNMSNADMPGRDEAFALKLDGSFTAERWGHMHSANKGTYEFQPHIVPNRDGSRVMFASGWDGATGATTVYAYVMEMLREDAAGPLGVY